MHSTSSAVFLVLVCTAVNGGPKPLNSDEVGQLRYQLQEIRNRVVTLLDGLESSTLASPPATSNTGAAGTTSGDLKLSKPHPAGAAAATGRPGSGPAETGLSPNASC